MILGVTPPPPCVLRTALFCPCVLRTASFFNLRTAYRLTTNTTIFGISIYINKYNDSMLHEHVQ